MLGAGRGDEVAEGFRVIDWGATTPCQRECTARLGRTIQLEQEAFLSQNPKIKCMLEAYYSNMVTSGKSRENFKDAAVKIMELCDDIDRTPGPRCQPRQQRSGDTEPTPGVERWARPQARRGQSLSPSHFFMHEQSEGAKETVKESELSFLQEILPVSDCNYFAVKEPIPTPEPTLSEVMMQVVSNTVDKAIYSQVNEAALRYDTAYVELSKAVEEAMEIPVIEIRADIAELFFCAYRMFELNIIEKERIAAEIAWEKRMRKKLKRTLRRLDNFKGYETPPTPKSEISSHPSYKVPPPRPCVCHPQFHYNRYPKDRFGIYLPRDEEFSKESVTVPVVCVEEETGSEEAAGST